MDHLLPTLKITSLSSRTVELAWLHPSKTRKELLNDIFYQVSRAELENLTFEVAYVGKDRMCSVAELKPLTKYVFKLRIGRMEEDELMHWSDGFAELEITTAGTRFFYCKAIDM